MIEREHYDMVLDILDMEYGLTDWEVNFAQELVAVLERGSALSTVQKMKIEEIHRERCE